MKLGPNTVSISADIRGKGFLELVEKSPMPFKLQLNLGWDDINVNTKQW